MKTKLMHRMAVMLTALIAILAFPAATMADELPTTAGSVLQDGIRYTVSQSVAINAP